MDIGAEHEPAEDEIPPEVRAAFVASIIDELNLGETADRLFNIEREDGTFVSTSMRDGLNRCVPLFIHLTMEEIYTRVLAMQAGIEAQGSYRFTPAEQAQTTAD